MVVEPIVEGTLHYQQQTYNGFILNEEYSGINKREEGGLKMTKQQAEQFINIYNALLTISTKGEDTKTMAQILMAMEDLANQIKIIEEPKEEKSEEKGE